MRPRPFARRQTTSPRPAVWICLKPRRGQEGSRQLLPSGRPLRLFLPPFPLPKRATQKGVRYWTEEVRLPSWPRRGLRQIQTAGRGEVVCPPGEGPRSHLNLSLPTLSTPQAIAESAQVLGRSQRSTGPTLHADVPHRSDQIVLLRGQEVRSASASRDPTCAARPAIMNPRKPTETLLRPCRPARRWPAQLSVAPDGVQSRPGRATPTSSHRSDRPRARPSAQELVLGPPRARHPSNPEPDGRHPWLFRFFRLDQTQRRTRRDRDSGSRPHAGVLVREMNFGRDSRRSKKDATSGWNSRYPPRSLKMPRRRAHHRRLGALLRLQGSLLRVR